MTSPTDPRLDIVTFLHAWPLIYCHSLWAVDFTEIQEQTQLIKHLFNTKNDRISSHSEGFGTKCYTFLPYVCICFAVKMNWLSNMDAILNCLPVPGKVLNVNVSKINVSRSAKHFSVRTTEQMVCICIFYFLEVVQLSGEVLCYVICDFYFRNLILFCHFILCFLISENWLSLQNRPICVLFIWFC